MFFTPPTYIERLRCGRVYDELCLTFSAAFGQGHLAVVEIDPIHDVQLAPHGGISKSLHYFDVSVSIIISLYEYFPFIAVRETGGVPGLIVIKRELLKTNVNCSIHFMACVRINIRGTGE